MKKAYLTVVAMFTMFVGQAYASSTQCSDECGSDMDCYYACLIRGLQGTEGKVELVSGVPNGSGSNSGASSSDTGNTNSTNAGDTNSTNAGGETTSSGQAANNTAATEDDDELLLVIDMSDEVKSPDSSATQNTPTVVSTTTVTDAAGNKVEVEKLADENAKNESAAVGSGADAAVKSAENAIEKAEEAEKSEEEVVASSRGEYEYSGIFNEYQVIPDVMAIHCKMDAADYLGNKQYMYDCINRYVSRMKGKKSSSGTSGAQEYAMLRYMALTDMLDVTFRRLADATVYAETVNNNEKAASDGTTVRDSLASMSNTNGILTGVINNMRELYAENLKYEAINGMSSIKPEVMQAVDLSEARNAKNKAERDAREAEKAKKQAELDAKMKAYKDSLPPVAVVQSTAKVVDNAPSQQETESTQAETKSTGSACTGGSYDACCNTCHGSGSCMGQCARACPERGTCTGGSEKECNLACGGNLKCRSRCAVDCAGVAKSSVKTPSTSVCKEFDGCMKKCAAVDTACQKKCEDVCPRCYNECKSYQTNDWNDLNKGWNDASGR